MFGVFFQIEYGRKNIDGANQMVNDKLSSLVAWRSGGPNQQNDHEAEVRRWTERNRKQCDNTHCVKEGGSMSYLTVHPLCSGDRVSHLGPGPLPHPAAPDHLPHAGLQPAGPPQQHPAGGALPQPLRLTNVHQLQQGQQAERRAGLGAEQQQSPAGQNERFPRQRHGLRGQQHAAQLAGRALLPTDGPGAEPEPG